MSYHKLTIVGNLGSDPEMRYTADGRAVTNFTLASNRQYTNSKSEKVKETVWFRISVWGNQAEACSNYLKKGSKVLVEGRMTPDKDTGGPRVWNKKDGTPASNYDVAASQVTFLDSRDSSPKEEEQDVAEEEGDEIPF